MKKLISLLVAIAVIAGSIPGHARYLQPDPLGLIDGPAVYNYARSNPYKYIDPEGLGTELILYSCTAGPNPICVGGAVLNACKWIGLGLAGLVALAPTQACAGDECCEGAPTPQQALAEAKRRGNELVKEYKLAGRGKGARSGQHGKPFKNAGA
ncbi:MAG: RHS repeat-associated core domain-containing protein [Pseudomonadota bacterium]